MNDGIHTVLHKSKPRMYNTKAWVKPLIFDQKTYSKKKENVGRTVDMRISIVKTTMDDTLLS